MEYPNTKCSCENCELSERVRRHENRLNTLDQLADQVADLREQLESLERSFWRHADDDDLHN